VEKKRGFLTTFLDYTFLEVIILHVIRSALNCFAVPEHVAIEVINAT